MTTRVWRLTIEKSNGQCVTVHGSEEILRAELDAWIEFETRTTDEAQQTEESGQTYNEYESFKPRVIHGHSDSADRTDVLVAYRFRDVLGMVLVEI